ncbi:MAG: class I SAM-dependent DNA methyltransferase [Bacteroidota bacterium]
MLTNPQLKSQVEALWNRFWSGGISNPVSAIEQMSFLIFLKRLDDIENTATASAKRRKQEHISIYKQYINYLKKTKAVIPAGLTGDKTGERLRWGYWTKLPGEEMLPFVRDTVFQFLRGLGFSADNAYAKNMQDATFIIQKPSLLQEAVKIIDDMHISDQNADVQGDLYEYLLNQLASSGKNGQFRTPRHIIRMITRMVNPKIGDRICDPAAGTSGFLVTAYEHILEQNTSKSILEYDEEGKAHNLIGDKITEPKLHKFLKSSAINGYDNDVTMVRIGAMNLMLHGIDNPNFKYSDALSKSFNESTLYDVVLANPPFKGSIDESDMNARFRIKTKKTELLFLELIYDLLVTGGRAGVIVPDGVLFGTSNAHVDLRKILVDKCQLQGIISMPSGVFKPYAGVSTAVLLFTKGGVTNKVWFYDMQADGMSLDDKRQKTTENDIPEILQEWNEYTAKSNKYKPKSNHVTMVDVADIRNNKYDLSISRYKAVKYTAAEYDAPEEVLEKLMQIESEITSVLVKLKSSL